MKKKNEKIRRLDKLGRVVIPKEIRDKFDIIEKDPLEMFVQGETIILKKFIPNCMFCGNEKKLIEFNGKLMCKNCCENIKNIKKDKGEN